MLRAGKVLRDQLFSSLLLDHSNNLLTGLPKSTPYPKFSSMGAVKLIFL